MSTKANPRIIGGFVVGAVFLAVVAVVSFGSGELMAEKQQFVAVFENESVSGLTDGSPVLFQGAKIGDVTDIIVRVDTDKEEVKIPVYLEVDRRSLQFAGATQWRPGEGMDIVVKQGLRAQLVTQSMITGQLAIMLDYFPDIPATLTGIDPSIPEIPTAPSFKEQLEQLFKKLQHIPIGDVVADARHAIQGIDELVRSPDIKQAIKSLDSALVDFQKLATDVDAQIDPIVTSFESTSTEARAALKQARESIVSVEGVLNKALEDVQHLVENVDGKLDPLTTSLQEALETANGALSQAKKTLGSAEGVISEDSPTIYLLNETLAELTGTLRTIRTLADFLEQHPDALIKGKTAPGGP